MAASATTNADFTALQFKDAKARLLETFEPTYLRAILSRHNGNITRAANAAGLTRCRSCRYASDTGYAVSTTSPSDLVLDESLPPSRLSQFHDCPLYHSTDECVGLA